jgi:hypothetical protein
MKKTLSFFLILLFLLPGIMATAQSTYDAHQAFAPLFYPHNGNTYRSADGAPGPHYWQNRADYRVTAKFDTATKMIRGEVKITYTNNSPNRLPFIWLELDQNIDRSDSRANVMRHPDAPENTAGFHIHQVQLVEGRKTADVPYLINDTRMQVRLPAPLKAGGGVLQMLISYDYILQPSGGGGRSGYLDTKGGRVFDVSYWYPRLEVYDGLLGWNTLPFLGGGEFYMDYGDIDYKIALPAGMIVAGSGKLQNPGDVLTPEETRRLEKARHSDKTVLIRTPSETGVPATRASSTGWLTWHFHMNNTRDVAWAASAAFIWDAARINLPDGKTSLAMSVYPRESAGDSSWGRATEYLKNSVELFSRHWFPYPYPVAINVGGPVGGMEFPGITFDWWKSKNKSLFALLSHEIGHNWFPMVVGSDERRYAWMDEGFNTFIDIYAQQHFHHGEYAPKRDGEYAPHGGNPADEIAAVIKRPDTPPIVTLPDALPSGEVHPLEYFKTAFGLVMLREVILGPDRFDYAFRRYIRDWAYKHPSPWDFFHEMENGAGEDLSWFWRGWFLHNWRLDQAVKGVKYPDNDPSKGALITIENLDKMPLPALVTITETGGRVIHLKLPVEIWQRGSTWTFKVNSTHTLKSVVLDPKKQLPDGNRANNTWKSS